MLVFLEALCPRSRPSAHSACFPDSYGVKVATASFATSCRKTGFKFGRLHGVSRVCLAPSSLNSRRAWSSVMLDLRANSLSIFCIPRHLYFLSLQQKVPKNASLPKGSLLCSRPSAQSDGLDGSHDPRRLVSLCHELTEDGIWVRQTPWCFSSASRAEFFER